MRPFVRAYLLFAYYLSWVWFGLGGLLLNLFCICLWIFPRNERQRVRVRNLIRWLFASWIKWFHASTVVKVIWKNFEQPLAGGTVYVANHPSLVDAPVLLGRLPNAICIFKPALLRNPLIAPAAILAGYTSGDRGVDAIRDAADKVAAGCSLLIFPEGTRTPVAQTLGPFKAGFALIAQRANAPIRLISIRATSGLVTKGAPWWKPPPLPGCFEMELGDELLPDEMGSASETTALVYARLANMLTTPPTSDQPCPRTSC